VFTVPAVPSAAVVGFPTVPLLPLVDVVDAAAAVPTVGVVAGTPAVWPFEHPASIAATRQTAIAERIVVP